MNNIATASRYNYAGSETRCCFASQGWQLYDPNVRLFAELLHHTVSGGILTDVYFLYVRYRNGIPGKVVQDTVSDALDALGRHGKDGGGPVDR